MNSLPEIHVKVLHSLHAKLISDNLILELVKHPKLPSQLPSSKVMLVGLLMVMPSMFLLVKYLNVCGVGKKEDIIIKSGYVDRYVHDLILNTSRVLPVESCRDPSKLDKPRWEMIKVITKLSDNAQQ